MQKLIGISLLLMLIISCTHFNKSRKKNEDMDGIIFIEDLEDERQIKASESGRKSSIGELGEPEDNEELRNFKEMDGIILLNFEDQIEEIPEKPFKSNSTKLENGKASYYAMKFKGRKTASGEIYDPNKLTAAHPSHSFGTRVRVTNLYNNTSVVVRINDRGPHVKSRIIDLSYAAAQQLDIISKGIADVAVEVIEQTRR